MTIDYGITTWLVVAFVAALTVMVGWKRPFGVLSALVILVPLRDFITRWLNVHSGLSVDDVTALGRWWFVLVGSLTLLLGARWVYRILRKPSRPKLGWVEFTLAAAVVAAAGGALLSPEKGAAFTSLRGYLQPLGVFLLALAMRPGKRELRRLIMLWGLVGIVMAGFALWQAAGWSEADYRAEGYLRQNGELVVPPVSIGGRLYLRPSSTVSGPNELGVDMVLLTLLALFSLDGAKGTRLVAYGALVLLFASGLAVSVSRSAFLALLAAAGATVALYWGRMRKRIGGLGPSARLRAALIGLGGLAAIGLVFARAGMLAHIVNTMENLAGAYHFVDSIEAVRYLVAHPQGVGMGLVEPKGALTLIEAGGTFHVEGSIFQIAMEMGVWGLAAWFALWAAALARVWRNWQDAVSAELRIVSGTAFAGWLGSLVAFLFLPLMQSISLMVWLWFLLGIGYSSDKIEAAWSTATVGAVLEPHAAASQIANSAATGG